MLTGREASVDGRVKGATEQAVRTGPARLKSASRAPKANPSPFVSLQFSQALAIRSYTKFVMGVSRAPRPFPRSWGPGWRLGGQLQWLEAGLSEGCWHRVSLPPEPGARVAVGGVADPRVSLQIAVSMLTYPFLLVGDLMAVNNCG